MVEVGKVLELNGNKAVLGFMRNSACKKCGACSLGSESQMMTLKLLNNLDVKVGDIVEVNMEPERLLQASFVIYVFPLLALIAGMILGYKFVDILPLAGNREVYSALCGMLFTVIAFVIIKALEPVWQKDSRFSPKMVSIIKADGK